MKSRTRSYHLVVLLPLVAMLLSLSPLLGTTSAPAADTDPPAPVTSLLASTGVSPGTIDLSWIASGDDGSTGTASAYVVRYNTAPITESNWAASNNVSGEPVPSPAGTMENMTVTGLSPSRAYYFAIKTEDEVPNSSGTSNSPRAVAQSSPNATFLPLVVSSAKNVVPVIPETTDVLPETTTQHLVSVSGDGTEFTFDQSAPELEALDPGDVMVGDATENAPYGFLRKVISVTPVGGQVIVDTEAATLEDAIESGAAHISHVLAPDQIQRGMQMQGVTLVTTPQAPNESYFQYDLDQVVLHDDDGDLNTTDDQITADGSIRLEPSFDFDIVVDGFQLEELSFTTNLNEQAELEIKTEIESPFIHKEKEIARHYFNPITVPIGPLPVTVVPVLTVNVGVDGSVHVGLTTGVTQQATLVAGLQFANETWSPVTEFSNEFHYNPPTLSAGLDLKGYAGAELSLMLYGVVGPHAEVDAYLKLEADLAQTPWWSLYGGLQVPVGVEIEIFSHLIAGYETTLIDYRLLLAQAQDNNPPNLPSNPTPAEGATNQSRNADLSWTGGDLDGDAVTYDVYFEANDATPDLLVANNQVDTAYNPGTLAANTHYCWRIVAKDEHGATNAGPVWDFVTESSINNPPNMPFDPSPADDAIDQDVDVDLSWSGGDPDGDAVMYDVYFEADNPYPSTLVSDDQVSTTYEPGALSPDTHYYWQVVAKDEYGAITYGPVWDFATIGQDLLAVAGYNGQYSGSTTVALPLVARSNLQTTLFVQNVAPDPANITVHFYDLDGNLVTVYDRSIPGFASVPIRQELMPTLPDGFEGSAVVISTAPVLAIANVELVGAASLLSYEGAPSGATDIVLPAIMRDWLGQETDFWVQNTSSNPAEVTITYSPYDTGTPYVVVDTIPARGTRVYHQAEIPQLGESFFGSATIEANQPVAAVVEIWELESSRAAAYRGISLSGVTHGILSPRQTKDAWSSSSLILNLGTADTQVQADWYSGDGSHTWIESHTLAPGMRIEHSLQTIDGIPAGFDGSLLATADQSLAALVSWSNPDAAGDGLVIQSGIPWESTRVGVRQQPGRWAFLPHVAYDPAGWGNAQLSIRNTSGTQAHVALYFYSDDGVTYTPVGPDLIPGHGVLRYTADEIPGLPEGRYAVVIESTEVMAVEAVQFLRWPW